MSTLKAAKFGAKSHFTALIHDSHFKFQMFQNNQLVLNLNLAATAQAAATTTTA